MKLIDHDASMEAFGICASCDLLKDGFTCTSPVRRGGAGLFMALSVGERDELRSLDAIAGLPDWFPFEERR